MHSVPREVNGTWYPVPCPDGVPISMRFPSAAECYGFILGLEVLEAAWAAREAELTRQFDKDSEADYDAGHEAGYEQGRLEALDEAEDKCAEGKCPGYDIGWREAIEHDKSAEQVS